jgi:hypothetical protein
VGSDSVATELGRLGILKDITFLEFVPIVLSMAILGSRLQNKKVKFYIDNRALVDIIDTQTSKSKRVAMKCVILSVDGGHLFSSP